MGRTRLRIFLTGHQSRRHCILRRPNRRKRHRRKYHREGFDMGLVLQSLLKIPEMGVPFSHFPLTTYTFDVV